MKLLHPLQIIVSLTVLICGVVSPVFSENRVLHLATTTSTDNTGLLDYLAPAFESSTGIELRWVAVGTGKALALGRNCDVDVLMVHAPAAEAEYIREGYGVERHPFMYNDFIIIGPKNDPAGIRGKNVTEVLNIIHRNGVYFASRGDDSGTNKREIQLWKETGLGIPDRVSWYIQTGQGMLNTINIAAEHDANTMTDRGTFIKYESNWKGDPPLVILVEGDRALRNQYSMIAVSPARCSEVRSDLAEEFIQWVLSPEAQGLIGEFTLMKKKLFIPNGGME
jgi:tungstate transport system substrate-binding protein